MSGLNQNASRQGGVVSTSNTTTQTLGANETYTGEWEQNGFSDVGVSCKSSSSGTLYFDFSNDRENIDSFPVAGFNVAAAIHEFHTAVKLPRWFRVRFVNGSDAQTYFRLYTYFGTFRQGNAPIGFNIADDADATVVKAVLSGVGDSTATVTDHKSLQVTPPREGKSSFGELLSAQLSHEIIVDFIYNINPKKVNKYENQSGTVTQANAMANCSTGAAANSSATMQTIDICRYQPGHGSRARFTSLFTTGVAGSTQISGIGDESNGFFFGYNGTSFGILHRKNGSPEFRTLTITTKSTTAENITITLDGDSTGDTVAVTDATATDATTTANEIAAHDYSDVGRGWTAKAVGNTVIFQSWDAATHTGSYSLSSATTAVGTFAQTIAGVAPTDTWTAQADWNGADIFDGNGLTGVTLDPTKGNVFQISYQWLGYGLISFYIEDPDDGEFHVVHSIEYANANTEPSLSNPSLPITISAENTTNTTDISVKAASLGAFTDGKSELNGPRRGLSANKVLSGISTETPAITIRNNQIYSGKKNSVQIKLMLIGGSVEHTKAVQIVFYKNATITGASFSDVETNVSTLQIDTSATSFTGGEEFYTLSLGKTGGGGINLSDDRFAGLLNPGDQITATIKPNSGNGAEGNVSFNIIELF